MAKKKQTAKPKLPKRDKNAEIKPPDLEEPLNIPTADPDTIPDEEGAFENPPPYEKPPLGEGP
ncbi:MAG TPA: hypothetical protein VF144_12460 [Chitinophagaceae bacterium]